MKKRQIAITTLCILIMQILLQVLLPVQAIAADEIVTIQCNDINFYNALIENLEGSIVSENDSTKTITMNRTEVDNVTSISKDNTNSSQESKITDITGIENFTNLTYLSLGDNNINDISKLEGLTKITELYLYGNAVSDITKIAGLTNLEQLDLLNNGVNDITPISNMTRLTALDLRGNGLENISAVTNLTNLNYLYLGDNRIKNVNYLNNLTSLKVLVLTGNGLEDISGLENLINLTRLDLDGNSITNVTALSQLTALKYLYLNDNQLSVITPMANLTNIEELDLANNQISNIEPLQNFSQLGNLNLANNRIEDTTPIEGLTNITNLNLSNNEIHATVSDGGNKEAILPQIIRNAKNSNSKIYTAEDYNIVGGSLSTDGTKLVIDTDSTDTASIQIQGGAADGTTFIVGLTDTTPPEVEVNYSTTKPTNQKVTVTLNANEEIQEIAGWSLSVGGTTLTKEYTANTEETVTILDLAGNKTIKEIKIANIDIKAPEVEVGYSTTNPTQQPVTVTITADEEIRELEGWNLGEDEKTLTKTYTENKVETVTITDLAGNTSPANVSVGNIDKEAPEIEVSYSSTSLTNQNVTVMITSNKEIQEVEGWTLGGDKKTLTKTYEENTSETVTIVDLAGNKVTANIKISNIDKVKPVLQVSYNPMSITNGSVTVVINSNKEIQEVEGWTLGEDKKTLTKTYTINTTETITVTDLAGNIVSQEISVQYIDKVAPKATVKYSSTVPTNQAVTVTIEADEEIQEVEGWTLGTSKKVLTKTYQQNGQETVTLVDLAGNKVTVHVAVNNIDKVNPTLTISYSTTKPTNQNVKATISSNEELQEVAGWTLGTDKKTLSKIYTENKTESVEVVDLAGNKVTANIRINNIDKEIPEAIIKYSTLDPTNQNVLVTIEMNEAVQEIEGWNLDASKKILTKEYEENGEEEVTILDLAGNKITAAILVDNIDKEAPEIEVEYSTLDETEDNVIVFLIPNEEIQIPTGWIFDEDDQSVYKEYDANTIETIMVKDLAGNETEVTIQIENIENGKGDGTVSDERLPQTGPTTILITTIGIVFCLGILGFIKYKKYKEY